MRLRFQQIESLPKLAWCARLVAGQDTATVLHGPWVETGPEFFCEGAWSGPFGAHDLDTGILMGSGGRIRGDTLVVATPSHSLVFTGFYGGTIWNKKTKKIDAHIVRSDPSGHNLGDFRLRVGWIHLPVPFLGCTSQASINRIANSEEMKPWSLRDTYDRPIPRRLIEEAGVDRRLFGTRKRAAGLKLDSEGLEERMTPESYRDYRTYYAQHWNRWMSLKSAVCRRLRTFHRRHQEANKRAAALLKRSLGIDLELPIVLPREFRIGRYGDLDDLALLVQWSIERIQPQYTVDARRPR